MGGITFLPFVRESKLPDKPAGGDKKATAAADKPKEPAAPAAPKAKTPAPVPAVAPAVVAPPAAPVAEAKAPAAAPRGPPAYTTPAPVQSSQATF